MVFQIEKRGKAMIIKRIESVYLSSICFYVQSFKVKLLISSSLIWRIQLFTQKEQKPFMNSISYQNSFTHFDLMFQTYSPFFYSFQHQHQLKDQINNSLTVEQRPSCFYYNPQQVQTPSFQSRMEPSIILKFSPRSTFTATTKYKKIKGLQKAVIVQKQSRNVISNLLRILLRNIMEARYYDGLIQKIIKKYCLSCDLKEFHIWIQSFNINYKNYIRLAQVKKLFKESHNQEMHRIIRILVREYSNDVGARHCLTSRRIDPTSINMHLAGLRDLLQQVIDR